MIAVDTSIVIAFFLDRPDAQKLDDLLIARKAVFPPIVLTELLSGQQLDPGPASLIFGVPLLPLQEGHWARAGSMRSALRAAGHKAGLADALIAQTCIDHEVPLVTLDRDYRHFVQFGLQLAP